MAGWAARAVAADDRASFAQFERSNRHAFEQFNEPHLPSYYNDRELARAFERCLDQHHHGRALTRVVVAKDTAHWLGVGRLKVHATGPRPFAVLIYQTDHRALRQGVGTALLADLMRQAAVLGMARLDAQITSDNLVSLHLLRRAGFSAAGWAAPATLLRGRVDCLLLSRAVRTLAGTSLTGAHMQLAA